MSCVFTENLTKNNYFILEDFNSLYKSEDRNTNSSNYHFVEKGISLSQSYKRHNNHHLKDESHFHIVCIGKSKRRHLRA